MADHATEISAFPHGRVPREVRERQLSELADQLFAERGYSGASMEELARRAGVTKPVIYELFGSKEGLFRRCVERSADRLAETITEAVRTETEPLRRLRAGSLAFLRFAADNRLTWDLMFLTGDGRFADATLSVRRRQAALVRELLAETAHDGVDPQELDAVAHAVNSAYEGAAYWMWEHPEVPVERLADWIVDLLIPGLRRFT